MSKVDLSKYLEASEAIKSGKPERLLAAQATLAMAYGARVAACKHRASPWERTDVKPRMLPNNLLATPRVCLDCGANVWMTHPGPRRQSRSEESAEE